MTSFLDKNGVFDPSKRYAFTNITDEPFTFHWAKVPITIQAGDTKELPEHLALLATKNLVDKLMIGEITIEEQKMKAKTKDPYWRSPKATSFGVPAARKPYEDQILRELAVDEESPEIAIMKAKIKEELMTDMSAEKSQSVSRISVGKEEFAEIKGK